MKKHLVLIGIGAAVSLALHRQAVADAVTAPAASFVTDAVPDTLSRGNADTVRTAFPAATASVAASRSGFLPCFFSRFSRSFPAGRFCWPLRGSPAAGGNDSGLWGGRASGRIRRIHGTGGPAKPLLCGRKTQHEHCRSRGACGQAVQRSAAFGRIRQQPGLEHADGAGHFGRTEQNVLTG